MPLGAAPVRTVLRPRPAAGAATYGAVLLACWGAWLLALWPGIVQDDALVQWRQIVTGVYDDWHPAPHTWLLWLLTRAWQSFGAVAAAQVLAGAALAGLGLAAVRRAGAPRVVVGAAFAWLALAPVFPVGLIAPWKDTTLGLALLGMLVVLLPVARGGRLDAWHAPALGLAAAVVWLVRHNGPLIVVPTLAVVAWRAGRTSRGAVAVAVATCATAVAVVLGPVAWAVGVVPRAHVNAQYQVAHRVAAHVAAGTPLTAEEAAGLETLMPLDGWRSGYECWSGERLYYFSGLRLDRVPERAAWLRALWLRLAWRAPRVELAHWWCATRFVLVPTTFVDVGLGPGGVEVLPNAYGIETRPVVPALHALLRPLLGATLDGRLVRVVVWSPALPLWAALLALAVACVRARGAAPLVLWTPALANTACWLLLAGHNYLRYQWPLVLVAPLLVCCALVRWRDAPDA